MLRVELENALKLTKELKTENKILKEKSIVTIQENSKFASFTIRVFWGLIVVVVLGIGFLFFKYKSKVLGI